MTDELYYPLEFSFVDQKESCVACHDDLVGMTRVIERAFPGHPYG